MKSIRAAVLDCIRELGQGCVEDVIRLLDRDGYPAARKQVIDALQSAKVDKRVKAVGHMPKPEYGRPMVIYALDAPQPKKEKPRRTDIPRVSCVWELGSFA